MSKEELRKYREQQALLAIHRDHALCAIHFFLFGERKPYEEVHHVFGRSRMAGDWKEHHSSLMCVCRACHPAGAARAPYGSHEKYIDVLRRANKTPINPDCYPVDSVFEEEFYNV